MSKRIKTTKEISLTQLISKIRKNFGDDNLFFTVSPFESDNTVQHSTFGRDNVKHLTGFIMFQEAKLVSGSVTAISVIVRRFLKGEKNMLKVGKVNIPYKEIYNFLITNEYIMLFDKKETYENQNTNSKTGKKMKEEEGLFYCDSINLYEELFNNKFEVDKILDKISATGKENLSKLELEFLTNQVKNEK